MIYREIVLCAAFQANVTITRKDFLFLVHTILQSDSSHSSLVHVNTIQKTQKRKGASHKSQSVVTITPLR